MADFVFNNVKGRVRFYLELPATNDGLFLVIAKAANLEADDTLNNYDTLAALFAAANDECDFTGYSRKAVTPAAAAVDDANNRVDVDAPDVSAYTNTGASAQAAGKAFLAYDPDTTVGDDTTLVPILAWDCVITFDVGVSTTLPFNAAGIFRAQ